MWLLVSSWLHFSWIFYILLQILFFIGKAETNIRVLSCITAYHSENNSYLANTLKQFKDICEEGYSVKVVIETVDWVLAATSHLISTIVCQRNPAHLDFEVEIFNEMVRLDLTGKHRRTIAKYIDQFDLFIYQEDDIVITSTHIHNFLSATESIENFFSEANITAAAEIPIVGLLRYEQLNTPSYHYSSSLGHIHNPARTKFLFEIPFTNFRMRCIGDMPVLADVVNPHQASWMLTRNQLLRLNRDCQFLNQGSVLLANYRSKMVYMSSFSIFAADHRVLSLLQLSANDSCNIEKVIPAIDFCSYGVHHSRQKYAHLLPMFTLNQAIYAAVEIALDPEARSNGDVPQCWQTAVDTNKIKFCSLD